MQFRLYGCDLCGIILLMWLPCSHPELTELTPKEMVTIHTKKPQRTEDTENTDDGEWGIGHLKLILVISVLSLHNIGITFP